MQDIIVSQIQARIGDASINLFRTSLNEPQTKSIGGKLLHEHVYYECHLLLSGDANFVIGERTINVQAHQLLIIPPKQNHRSFKSVAIKSNTAERVFGLTLETCVGDPCCCSRFHTALQEAACTPIDLSHQLYDQLIEFLNGFDEHGGLRTQCKQLARIYPLLYSLFDLLNAFELPQYSSQNLQNTDIAVILDEMVNEPNYSLKDISHRLGYSYRHTARKIRGIYGESLVNVRRKKMLSSAKTLLIQNPKTPLESIARQSGFPGMHTMIRAFRSIENTTPTEYKTKMLSSEKGGTQE